MRIAFALTLACGLGASNLVVAQTPRPQAADVVNNPFASDPRASRAGRDFVRPHLLGLPRPGRHRRARARPGQRHFQHGGSDNELFTTIKSGVQGTQMPSFSALPSDDVWRLVTYIKSLSGQTGSSGRRHRRCGERRGAFLRQGRLHQLP